MPHNAYLELQNRMTLAGLMNKQRWYYTLLMAAIGIALILCLTIFSLAPNNLVLFLNSLFYASITVHLGFLVHDASHKSIFLSRRNNDVVGLTAGNLLSGASYGWYAPLHARHHAHPNLVGIDPDLTIIETVLALSGKTAACASGLKRLLVRYQVYVLPLVMAFQVFALKCYAIGFLIREKSQRRWLEVGLLAVHYAFYLSFFAGYLGLRRALAVIVIQHCAAGLYLSALIVPNHVGRPLLWDKPANWFAMQFEESRNFRTPRSLEFLCGGINHHIEHHLFPSMSRNQLRRALVITKQFCRERDIPYCEITFTDCYREVFATLSQAAEVTREPMAGKR